MSQTIILELSEFDAALLSELSKREAKTPEELILEALHGLFASRLDDKIIPLSPDVFDACSKIIFEPEKDKEVLRKLCKIRNFSQSPFGGFIFEESDGNFPSGRN